MIFLFFFSSRRRHTRCALVTGVQTCALPICKREESLQDVPVAVTALSEAVIQQRDITSIEKIAAATPNLNVGRASNGSAAQIKIGRASCRERVCQYV